MGPKVGSGKSIPAIIKDTYHDFVSDSLYRNSFYLMASTVITAGLGFLFWMVAARLYTPEEIGIGSTLISLINLITTFSLLGFNATLIRFLPLSKSKGDKINTALSVTGLASVIVTSLFLLSLQFTSPRLLFVQRNIYYSLFFIAAMVVMTYFSLIESVFVAYRSSHYVLLKNAVYSIVKVLLPGALVSFGAMGIFASWALSALMGLAVSFAVLAFVYGHSLKLVIYDRIISKVFRYSFSNYITGFIGGLPGMVIPLIITNKLNPEATAHYYVAMMIANLLFMIPVAITSSLFAEGSYSEHMVGQQTAKAVKIMALLMVPAMGVIMVAGNSILLLFGKSYSDEASLLLRLVSLSSIFMAANAVYSTLFRIRHKMKELVIRSFIGSAILLTLSYAVAPQGLLAIGIAWIVGQGLSTGAYIVLMGPSSQKL